jgi:hypothetical protein
MKLVLTESQARRFLDAGIVRAEDIIISKPILIPPHTERRIEMARRKPKPKPGKKVPNTAAPARKGPKRK